MCPQFSTFAPQPKPKNKMKFLKRLGIFILALLVVWIVLALFQPKVVHVQRSMVMNTDAATVYSQVNTLKNWKVWSFWDNIDKKTMKDTWEGPESGVGAIHKWESPNDSVGKGTLTITKSEANKLVETKLEFDGKGEAMGGVRLADTTGGTNVTWYMDMEIPFFFRPMCLFMNMDKMLGPDFEKTLSNLKSTCENMPKPMEFAMGEKDQPSMMVLTILDSVKTIDQIGPKLGELYGKIGAELKEANGKMAGPVFAIYHTFAPGNKIVLEAGVPVDKKIEKTSAPVKYWETKAGKVVSLDYYGPYDKMQPAYDQVKKWAQDNNKKLADAPWEIYVGDPGVEKDPMKILTQLVYYVE
jgi:effector-binding domain-containing protein